MGERRRRQPRRPQSSHYLRDGRLMPKDERDWQEKAQAAVVRWRAERRAQQTSQDAPGRAPTADDPGVVSG
jgi:hypothetical protein